MSYSNANVSAASSRTNKDSVSGVFSNETRELTIGEMSAEFHVSLRTLRFYEDRKLLNPRRQGYSRFYSKEDYLKMQMIVKGKQLGFTLTEISELIQGSESLNEFEDKLQPQQIVEQIDHLERQRAEIEGAIARLRATHERLAGAYSDATQALAASA